MRNLSGKRHPGSHQREREHDARDDELGEHAGEQAQGGAEAGAGGVPGRLALVLVFGNEGTQEGAYDDAEGEDEEGTHHEANHAAPEGLLAAAELARSQSGGDIICQGAEDGQCQQDAPEPPGGVGRAGGQGIAHTAAQRHKAAGVGQHCPQKTRDIQHHGGGIQRTAPVIYPRQPVPELTQRPHSHYSLIINH